MTALDPVHAAIDTRSDGAVRAVMRLIDKAKLPIDQRALVRETYIAEIHGLRDLAHNLVDAVAGDDVVPNEVYIDELLRQPPRRP